MQENKSGFFSEHSV